LQGLQVLGQHEYNESESSRPVQFSELAIDVPAEIGAFCLTLLWTLKNKGLVQDWRWEEGVQPDFPTVRRR
jgi:hypothetical protein